MTCFIPTVRRPSLIAVKAETKLQPAFAISSSSLSYPSIDKVVQVIKPAKTIPDKSKPTSDVGFSATTQLANVITIGEKNNSGAKIWLMLAVITGIIGGAGVFLARRKNSFPDN